MTTKANKRSIYMVVVVLLAGVLACSVLQPTSQPPAQNVVPTSPPATNAPAPTEAPATSVPATPKPTATAEPAGIEQFPEFQALLNQMRDKGYIKSTEGSFVTVDDFSEEWAQINWYQYWTAQEEVGDFVFTGHFKWSTASATPEDSGCGVVFGLQSNGDHYAVFLSQSRILFLRAAQAYGNKSYEVGKTKGSGRVRFSNPAEADFALAVTGKKAYVYVDKQFIGEYTLSADQLTHGELDLTILSGTNKDFGTRCEMSNIGLLMIE